MREDNKIDFSANPNQNLSDEELRQLFLWAHTELDKKLKEGMHPDEPSPNQKHVEEPDPSPFL